MRTEVPASHYDVVIIGAGIAGSALAYALSSRSTDTTHSNQYGSRKLRVALIERSLSKPDRIVGELLQPGGIIALRELGLEVCLEGIGAIPVRGYCVVEGERQVTVPYPDGFEGRSFHHGEFVMTLRDKAIGADGVDVIEAVVTELIEESESGRIAGVRYRTREASNATSTHELHAKVVIVADGSASKFRKQVLQPAYAAKVEPRLISHFVGLILEGAELPVAQHGTVVFVGGHGPVLLYQISEGCTRMLIDVKEPLPADMKSHILTEIVPQLPPSLRLPATCAVHSDRLRRMPCPFLTAINQNSYHTKPGAILLGDAWNTRHPLTGGGMTVALNDVVLLRDMLNKVDDLGDWTAMEAGLSRWYWQRKPRSSTINMLSLVLYELFGAADEELSIMRLGCFKYFELGGEYNIELPVPTVSSFLWRCDVRHLGSIPIYSVTLFTPISSYNQSPTRDERSSQHPGALYVLAHQERARDESNGSGARVHGFELPPTFSDGTNAALTLSMTEDIAEEEKMLGSDPSGID
ncbi:hypothetical protein CCMSSC00406_0004279 [Pleurotus cornucopiae]|uniref:Uncharacterized protein n=1 Tax=Pleurotus cornucopiae TaxID=5321 RepID=A0ACB7J9B8_PLECO|nr:hypothetical protein CCMSSC00406_0004279 [Pleurotus cornucopiae]